MQFYNFIQLVIFCVLLNENLSSVFSEVQNDDDSKMHARGRRPKSLRILNSQEKTASYWIDLAQNKLKSQILKEKNTNIAKNVILFLGAGMSITTVTAARIYKGQKGGRKGEEEKLSFEDFPHVGLSKTYCIDKQTADSSCTATAYLCGVKANFATIGVTGEVGFDDCNASSNKNNHVSSLMDWAQKANKGTGIVTTTRVTHASPAGAYAHVANRFWENDADVIFSRKDPKICDDIAKQLIRNSPGNKLKVILGGGRNKFLPKTFLDQEGQSGGREDNLNLINEWKSSKNGRRSEFIYNRDGLMNLDTAKTEYVLGLFESHHMQYHLDADKTTEPTLAEMTKTAIKMLQKEEKGFVLFVEGGRIDQAHHDNLARKALDETVEFSEAIRVAKEMTNSKDTLIIVTADHSHSFTLNGYSVRGKDILGLSSNIADISKLPYTTLSYANGPSATGTVKLIKEADLLDKNYKYPSNDAMGYETHGGEDVAVYADGPSSHLFSGTYEQNVIPHIAAYAARI